MTLLHGFCEATWDWLKERMQRAFTGNEASISMGGMRAKEQIGTISQGKLI